MTKFIIINECSLKYFAYNVCISLLFSILFNHFYGKEIKSTFVQITGQRTIMMITTTSTTKNSASNSTAAASTKALKNYFTDIPRKEGT